MDGRPVLLSVLVLGAVPALAGCLGGLGSGGPLADDEVRTRWPLAGDGCTAVAATVPVDKFQVERILPQGFEPVDSSGTFGFPEDSGRTNLTLLTASCEDGEAGDRDLEIPALAWTLVRVHPVGAAEGEADATLYGFTVHGEDPGLRQTLRAMGHADNRSKVVVNLTSTSLGSGGEATVAGDDTLYRIRTGAGNPADRYETFRVYHKGDRGLLVLDAAWSGSGPAEGSAELAVNEGSRMGRLMDDTRQPAYGVVREDASLEGAWRLVGGEASRQG